MTAPEKSPKLRCPTCGALQSWSDTCRRCRCDLQLVHQALRAVESHRRQCLQHLRDDRYEAAWAAAQRCCELDNCEENRQLLALVEFIRGNFPVAARLAQGAHLTGSFRSPDADARERRSPNPRQPLMARWPR